MSRFFNLRLKDINNLTPKKKQSLIKKNNYLDYVSLICEVLETLNLGYTKEYKFLYDRRFRFDVAVPSKKIAIEYEGGVWSGGRHTRGKGYINDCKKYNLATMYGWKLLRYTAEDFKTINWRQNILSDIKKII